MAKACKAKSTSYISSNSFTSAHETRLYSLSIECHPNKRKRTSNSTERPYVVRTQRKLLIEGSETDFAEKSTPTKYIESLSTSSESSVKAITAFISFRVADMAGPVLSIKQGDLRGKVYRTQNGVEFYGFLGIPYAAPPVGDLRFKSPLPAASWTGVRDATKEGNMCCQVDLEVNVGCVNGNEDCLLLSVFFSPTVKIEEKPLPVMVYFHGGGFLSGSKDSVFQGPHFFVEQGVVVVNINYRLGIFGFLNLDLPEAQGNMGLKDQVLALRWIQENISKFNGDPSNVTVFGISAGAVSINNLCLSDLGDELFHKAIIQSGCPLNYWGHGTRIKELAFSIAKKQGKEISDANELLQYLKSLPASELVVMALNEVPISGGKGGFSFEFVPSIEKVFPNQEAIISEDHLELLKRGTFKKIPYIMGYCKNEGIWPISKYPELKNKLVKKKDFLSMLPFKLNHDQENSFKERFKTTYIDTIKSNDVENQFAVDFSTDQGFLSGLYTTAKLMGQKHSPVYFYEFAYDGTLNFIKSALGLKRAGTCHGDDLGYLFFNPLLPLNCPQTDQLVRQRMVKMWTNFAKYGNPTPKRTELLPNIWKPVTKDSFEYLIIDDKLTSAKDPYPQRMKIFEDLYLNH